LVEKEEFNIFYVAITRAKEAVFLDSDYYDTFSNCIQNKETLKCHYLSRQLFESLSSNL
jgi:ATP-dependent exoDNAse (exonuclease V) beta subunit